MVNKINYQFRGPLENETKVVFLFASHCSVVALLFGKSTLDPNNTRTTPEQN